MSIMTKIVNFRVEKCDFKVSRKRDNTIPDYPEQGFAGNPFFLKDVNNDEERDHVCNLYEEYFYDRIAKDENFRAGILSLKGKVLGCFCKPKRCHGDTIVKWLESIDLDKGEN